MQLSGLGLYSEIQTHCLVLKPPMGFGLRSGFGLSDFRYLGMFRVDFELKVGFGSIWVKRLVLRVLGEKFEFVTSELVPPSLIRRQGVKMGCLHLQRHKLASNYP